MNKLLAHFGRLGGVIISPRQTFSRIVLDGEGNLLELVPWIALVAVAIAPADAGRAILWFRINWWEGVTSLVTMLSNRMALPLGSALAGGIVLYLGETIFRSGEEKRGFDLALDAAAFTLVPHLLLAALGSMLSVLGAELWWMPHHPALRGIPAHMALRGAVAFGWSIALFALVASIFWKRGPTARPVE
jgi:hypothetical protein